MSPTPIFLVRALLRSVLLLGLLGGCQTFPISLFVPDETLATLEHSEYVEKLDQDELETLLAQHFGLLAATRSQDDKGVHRLDSMPESGPHRNEELNSAFHPATRGLRSGDLLLAKNSKPQSLGQTLTFEDFTYYSHMAILAREGGRYYAYESWPRLHLMAAADQFAERFRGGVQRVPFADFLERYETIEVLRLSRDSFGADIGERLSDAAKDSLQENIRYDPHHDPNDPAMSCSEYVSYLIEDKLGRSLTLRRRTVTQNPSMQSLLSSLGFRTDAYVVPESYSELPDTETVALYSHQATHASYLGKRYAYQALHEHFVSNSSIASYLGIHPLKLVKYRRNVKDYLRWAVAYSEAHAGEDPDSIRRDLRAMVELFFRRKGMKVHGRS